MSVCVFHGGVYVARPDVTCVLSEHERKHESSFGRTHSSGPPAVDAGGVVKRAA